MINRAALLLRYKEPAIQWINNTDPDDDAPEIELDRVNQELTVYLIPDRAAVDDDTVRMWVELNHEALLQNELSGWMTDESCWPEALNLELLNEWFDIECHSIIIDTSDEPITEEDYDDEIH